MSQEHLIVNVEAGLARRISREADALEAQAEELRARVRVESENADAIEDLFERAKAQQKVRDDVARVTRLEQIAAETRAVARKAVERALSVPDGTDPAELDPVRRVPLTKKEIADRVAMLDAERLVKMRIRRNALLAGSDWTQQPDAPLPDKQREAWAKYRQQLRDLPAKTTDPTKVKWPEAPA